MAFAAEYDLVGFCLIEIKCSYIIRKFQCAWMFLHIHVKWVISGL